MAVKKSTEPKLKDFEKSLDSLEELVGQLESGKIGLAESIEKFEKGVTLYRDCKKLLSQAEKKVKVLTDQLEEEDWEE
jgi:exodeoxyribonuclease VII small subunit